MVFSDWCQTIKQEFLLNPTSLKHYSINWAEIGITLEIPYQTLQKVIDNLCEEGIVERQYDYGSSIRYKKSEELQQEAKNLYEKALAYIAQKCKDGDKKQNESVQIDYYDLMNHLEIDSISIIKYIRDFLVEYNIVDGNNGELIASEDKIVDLIKGLNSDGEIAGSEDKRTRSNADDERDLRSRLKFEPKKNPYRNDTKHNLSDTKTTVSTR